MTINNLGALALAIVETIRAPVLVLDGSLVVGAVNRAFLSTFAETLGGTVGRKVMDLGNGQWDIAELRYLLDTLLPECTIVHDYEVTHNFPVIGQRTMVLNARRLEQLDSSTTLILIVFEDVTEERAVTVLRAREQRELERSNAALAEFAHAASHDLQEPLRKIAAFADRVATQHGALLPREGQDYLARIAAAAIRMRGLVEGLLLCARTSTEVPEMEGIDLDAIAREVLDDLEAVVEKLGASVLVSGLPVVEANAFQMRQLFQNLISNALKFHRPDQHPRITITGAEVGAWVELCVQDDGIGFDPKYSDRIFGMFKRLHGRAAYEGNGIGLSLCRTIVERHNGTITVSSEPGVGTTFTVRLPATQSRPLEEVA